MINITCNNFITNCVIKLCVHACNDNAWIRRGRGGVQAQLTEQFLAKFFSPWVQWLNLSKTVVFQGSRGGGGIQHFPEDPTLFQGFL